MTDVKTFKLCLVDDEPDLLDHLATIFAENGYEVHCFSSAEEVMDHVFTHSEDSWDLIISDIHMADRSGIDLCRQMRAQNNDHYLPIILITGSGSEEQRIQGIQAGADDFFEKPFKPEVILEKTRYLLELKDRFEKAIQKNFEIREKNLVLNDRLEDFERFLPPKIASLLQSGRSSETLQKHRAEISVCFIDLRRFTEFSETAEPEDVLQVLEDYYRVVGSSIDRYEATLGHLSGDGVMIFLNDPEKREDHQLELARMSIEIQQHMILLRQKWNLKEFNLDFGIGLADGHATIGAVGVDRYWQYTVIGTVVNLSSRLCQLADYGQILCSHRFASKLDSSFEAKLFQKKSFKGIQKPIQIHEIQLNSN